MGDAWNNIGEIDGRTEPTRLRQRGVLIYIMEKIHRARDHLSDVW